MQYKKSVFYILCFAGIGGILYGYDIGVISGALLYFQNDLSLTTPQLSLIVAAVLGGGSVATLISGILSDLFGRKKMIVVSSIIFILGVIILINAQQFYSVLTGRIIQGIGVGIVTMIIPLYMVETVPTELRGRGIAIFQCFLTAGILLASVIDIAFAKTGNWRAMFACAIVPAVILLLGAFGLSESPRWLFQKGLIAKAQSAMLQFRSAQESELEIHEMQELSKIKHERRESLLKKQYIVPFLIALGIACLNQLTGINSLLQFSTYIIKQSGMSSNIVSMVGTVGITGLNFLTTVLVFFLIDVIGRRPLMNFGTIGMTLALIFLGCVSHFMPVGLTQGYLIITGLLLFIFSYALGPGVIVWLAISELLPTAIRGNGMAICLFVNSLVSTILASVFLSISNYLGYAGDFWFCAVFTTLYFVLVYRYLPESKAKSLEEIEEEFRERLS